ncbi:hypothetical protein RRG08_028907 [Elysia crispata]|uniref:Uncharacterized protein n=1 Tax=Elysia crispata TaxID=231223 RepID=A0AAE1E298_9GAST|nr:hypothetical protein RRG08_028907 [Elysia crispata]
MYLYLSSEFWGKPSTYLHKDIPLSLSFPSLVTPSGKTPEDSMIRFNLSWGTAAQTMCGQALSNHRVGQLQDDLIEYRSPCCWVLVAVSSSLARQASVSLSLLLSMMRSSSL